MTSSVRVLSIAGSDSSGGAGIQADIKTISALGGYAMTAITALTAQNTKGITGIVPVAPEFLEAQIRACLEDIGADAIKIGMLPSGDAVRVVCELLGELTGDIPVVVDPVLVATTGKSLADASVLPAVKSHLVPLADIILPNLDEAEQLSGRSVRSVADMKAAADKIVEGLGARSVLVTGGHLKGDEIVDLLVHQAGEKQFSFPRLEGAGTHGTGCTLSSALATMLGEGKDIEDAAEEAISFVRSAISAAEGLGAGNGPLNHQFALTKPEDKEK